MVFEALRGALADSGLAIDDITQLPAGGRDRCEELN
jgi:hypothetical protein